jgi:hypothetical protein
MVKFFETFFTHYFNNPKQVPTVESQKYNLKANLRKFTLEVVILECSFQNHGQGIVEVKHKWHMKFIYVFYNQPNLCHIT